MPSRVQRGVVRARTLNGAATPAGDGLPGVLRPCLANRWQRMLPLMHLAVLPPPGDSHDVLDCASRPDSDELECFPRPKVSTGWLVDDQVISPQCGRNSNVVCDLLRCVSQ